MRLEEIINFPHTPPESYSRHMDKMIAASEMPYGYTNDPPPADSGDYDSRARETHMGVHYGRKRK